MRRGVRAAFAADYRCRFLARHPTGLLPNAAALRAAKKSPEAFPATGNLPFCFDDIERHWRRDLPPLEAGETRFTMLTPGGPVIGQGPDDDLRADPLAGPLYDASTALLAAVVGDTAP